jgi:hypothetical protein
MAVGLLEAVRGLHLAHPELGPKPLLAKLREQQPNLAAGNKEVREALAALKAEESKAPEAAAATPPAVTAPPAAEERGAPPPPDVTIIRVMWISFLPPVSSDHILPDTRALHTSPDIREKAPGPPCTGPGTSGLDTPSCVTHRAPAPALGARPSPGPRVRSMCVSCRTGTKQPLVRPRSSVGQRQSMRAWALSESARGSGSTDAK